MNNPMQGDEPLDDVQVEQMATALQELLVLLTPQDRSKEEVRLEQADWSDEGVPEAHPDREHDDEVNRQVARQDALADAGRFPLVVVEAGRT